MVGAGRRDRPARRSSRQAGPRRRLRDWRSRVGSGRACAGQGLGSRAERRMRSVAGARLPRNVGLPPGRRRRCRFGTAGSTPSCSASSSISSTAAGRFRRRHGCLLRSAGSSSRHLRPSISSTYWAGVLPLDRRDRPRALPDGAGARARARVGGLPRRDERADFVASQNHARARARADPRAPHLDVRPARPRGAARGDTSRREGAACRDRGAPRAGRRRCGSRIPMMTLSVVGAVAGRCVPTSADGMEMRATPTTARTRSRLCRRCPVCRV